MTSQQDRDTAETAEERPGDRFVWHPSFQGRSVAEVRASLRDELASDQRAYALALAGAEEHEGDTLTTVVALDRTWGPFDLDWSEMDADALAERIVAFEQERERRQELISYAVYRAQLAPAGATDHRRHRAATDGGSTDPTRLLAAALAIAVVAVVLIWLLVR